MGQVGERLRQAREAKGLTLARVEEITKIRRRYLQALEEEDYGQLPGEVFIRGFLRNYAQALDLDPDEILEAAGRKAPDPLAGRMAAGDFLDEPLVEPSTGQRAVSIAIGVMVVIVVGLGGWTLYHYFGPSGYEPPPGPPVVETPATAGIEETSVVPTSTPRPTATSRPTATATAAPSPTLTVADTPEPTAIPPTPEPAMGVLLRVEASQDSWLHVDTDDTFAYEGNMTPGQILEWTATNKILLSTNNAGGLRVWYNGQEQQPLGGDGEGVEQTWEAGPLPPPEATAEPLGPPPEPGSENP